MQAFLYTVMALVTLSIIVIAFSVLYESVLIHWIAKRKKPNEVKENVDNVNE